MGRVEGCLGCLSEVFERKNDVKRMLCRKVVAGHGQLAVRCCMLKQREVRRGTEVTEVTRVSERGCGRRGEGVDERDEGQRV